MKADIYRSGEYLENNPSFHVEDSRFKATQIVKMLKKHHLHPQTIAEIGCGAGEILRQLQTDLPDASITGFDISPQAISLAKQRENERLHFFCEDLLLKDPQFFDLLLCIDVFEHVEDYLGFIKQLRRHGQFIMFHIPLDMNVSSVLRRRPFIEARENLGHIHYFMKDTALAALKDSGYEVVDYAFTSGYLWLARRMKTYFAMVPRMLLSCLSQELSARVLGGSSLLVLTKTNVAEPS